MVGDEVGHVNVAGVERADVCEPRGDLGQVLHRDRSSVGGDKIADADVLLVVIRIWARFEEGIARFGERGTLDLDGLCACAVVALAL